MIAPVMKAEKGRLDKGYSKENALKISAETEKLMFVYPGLSFKEALEQAKKLYEGEK